MSGSADACPRDGKVGHSKPDDRGNDHRSDRTPDNPAVAGDRVNVRDGIVSALGKETTFASPEYLSGARLGHAAILLNLAFQFLIV